MRRIFNEEIKDASDTVEKYLNNAIRMLEEKFPNGYVENHPELVIACIRAQSEHANKMVEIDALEKIASAIRTIH